MYGVQSAILHDQEYFTYFTSEKLFTNLLLTLVLLTKHQVARKLITRNL
jgi:hypothetical protein